MNLNKIFNPRSIAVVGASSKLGTVGNDIVKNLVVEGYQGNIYPVNPHIPELYSLKCYPDIKSIGKRVDLVVIAIHANSVAEVVEEAGLCGAGSIVVISAGFKESGNPELETQIRGICEKYKMPLVGPNCLGVVNPHIKMNASFAVLMPHSGSVAFLSQSGALCTSVIDYANKLGIGFSKFVSLGNKAMIDEVAMLEYLMKDRDTKVIAMYTEELKNPQRIIEIVKKNNKGRHAKPVIAIKAGRSLAGATASASHTGALAGNDSAYEALFDQAGIIRAYRISELFQYVQVFQNNQLPNGSNVAIVTNAGGPGVLATDEMEIDGLNIAKFSEATNVGLRKVLPSEASIRNPVDLLGDAGADRYASALKLVVNDKNVDSLLVLLTPQSMTQVDATASAIIEIKNKTKKPFIVSFMGEDTVGAGVQKMLQAGVAAANFPEQAAKALVAMTRFAERKKISDGKFVTYRDVDRKLVKKILTEAKNKGITKFPEAEAVKIFSAYKFPLLKSVLVTSRKEAEKSALSFKEKIVFKIVSPDILHKTDVGGVMLNITPDEAGDKYDEFITNVRKKASKAVIEGVLIEQMLDRERGVEVILGASNDPSLGKMIMVGLGGIFVEVFKDVSFRLPPLTKNDIERMINKLKSKKIFDGVRGRSALDGDALIECVGRLCQLLADFPEIKELDINPLLVLPKGEEARVLDGRIVIN